MITSQHHRPIQLSLHLTGEAARGLLSGHDLGRLALPVPHAFKGDANCAMPLNVVSDEAVEAVEAHLPHDIRTSRGIRRRTFLAGRLCAEAALRRLGCSHTVDRGVMGEPLWPSGFTGSISHTSEMAYAVVAREAETGRFGIDTERIADWEDLRAIHGICCTRDELDSLPALHDPVFATVMFSAKESLYKAIHDRVRRIVEFEEAKMIGLDEATGTFSLAPAPSLARLVPVVVGHFTVESGWVHTSLVLPQPQYRAYTNGFPPSG